MRYYPADEHHLARHPLPTVEVTAVDRSEERPTDLATSGFIVHITEDLTSRCSDTTVDAPQPPSTEDRALLIAATPVAGAEHLLDDSAFSLPPYLPEDR